MNNQMVGARVGTYTTEINLEMDGDLEVCGLRAVSRELQPLVDAIPLHLDVPASIQAVLL